jgi:uncharacterized protein
MRDPLPQSVDPRRLAEIGRELTGSLPLGSLPRLAAVICEPAGGAGSAAEGSGGEGGEGGEESVAFRLGFHRDAGGRSLVQGEVAATLRLRCERCNGIVEMRVVSNFTLAVVAGLDEVAKLPEDYEPLLPEDGAVDPAVLVEDELLLALPAVVRHPDGACRPPLYAHPDDRVEAAASTRKNPFAVLETLKRRH